MNTPMLKKIPVYAAAGLMLAAVVHAQSGPMKAGQSCMMGEMKMDGPVSANGQSCQMKCDMTPMGKSKGMMDHSMMGKGGMSMGKTPMKEPMKMMGTMSCMGQTYHCNMTVTPKAK